MTGWSRAQAEHLAAPTEIEVVTRRADGTVRSPRIIWVVSDGDRVFIRSTNGRTADWFRSALRTGSGQILAGGAVHGITFTEAAPDDLPAVDAAYRAKYGGRYAGIVAHLLQEGPRSATLQVFPT
jgi:hypothetical protein